MTSGVKCFRPTGGCGTPARVDRSEPYRKLRTDWDFHGDPKMVFVRAIRPGQQPVPRNFGTGPRFFTTHLKLSRTFSVNPAANSPAPAKRNYSLTLAVQVQNVFNHTNPDVPVGNVGSPSFGRSYWSVGDFGFGSNSSGNRRIEAQIYFGF
jgi:hypothetical protein